MPSSHLTFVTLGRHPMFADEASRREALHALGQVLAEKLVLFAIVDDHLHLVVSVALEDARRLARVVSLVIAPIAAVEVLPAHVEEVRDQRHLANLFGYCLEQPLHHGLDEHPALYSGSCYAEVAGARLVPGLKLSLETAFLDRRIPDPASFVGLPSAPLAPCPLPQVRALGAFRLVGAASFAAAAPPRLTGRDPWTNAARRVVACLGDEAGIDHRELAAALEVGADSVRRLQARGADPALLFATRLRLELEMRVVVACRRATIREMAEAVARRKIQTRRAAGG